MKCRQHPDTEIIPVMGFEPSGVCFKCVKEMQEHLRSSNSEESELLTMARKLSSLARAIYDGNDHDDVVDKLITAHNAIGWILNHSFGIKIEVLTTNNLLRKRK